MTCKQTEREELRAESNGNAGSKRMKTASAVAIVFSSFTVINYILLICGQEYVLPLSGFLPQYLLSFGEYSSDILGNGLHNIFFNALSALITLTLVISSALSVKYKAFLVPVLVITVIDTVFMAFHFTVNLALLINTNPIGMALQALFHISSSAYLSLGVYELKKITDKQ